MVGDRTVDLQIASSVEKNIVEVTNCFAVPHNESDDEVAVDIEYARNMYELHKKVNSNENIIGWFSTGLEVSVHSVLIHDYYSRETKNPIHMTVDAHVKGGKMSIKAYLRTQNVTWSRSVGGKRERRIGLGLTLEIQGLIYLRDEQTGDGQSHLREHGAVNLWARWQPGTACAGKIQSDNQTGRYLLDLVTSVPHIDSEKFEEMLNANMKDLLMVVYLANLTKTQLALNEKLSTL
ncbi:eukaryotic translation initiation factor 3 subunit F [Elysia marginata]|uniref:Eukaryotic translation initiation factor 3 subunit F n=1 Tax=Elysia marginata TaxID=1093978 RepID=A0AAV4H423_9GAST|nr:eukaryotic translation initiation factor 3 subunit F [Elysia marginata]